jgi:endonuclease/exonuclease/phosphatase family metal-dependent hydrolase
MARRLIAFSAWNKTKTVWRVAAGLAVLFAAIAWHASLRVPTGAAGGGPLRPPATARGPAQDLIRIGTFNMHHGQGPDGRLDLERTAKTLAGLDFVGLNEVGGRWPWQSADQAHQLGALTGQSFLFAPFERRWYCYEFGNALLSRLPITAWRRTPLPGKRRWPRNVLVATVGERGRTFRAIVVHATRRFPEQRAAELRAVFELFLTTAQPVVLLGDLNAGPDDPPLRQLLATPGVIDALDQPDIPRARIDWILVRGLQPVRAGRVDQGASDHPLFWAEVRFPKQVQ